MKVVVQNHQGARIVGRHIGCNVVPQILCNELVELHGREIALTRQSLRINYAPMPTGVELLDHVR